MLKRIALLLVIGLAALPAHADDFIKPTLPDLVRTMVKFNALSLDDERLLNEYAILTECKLYQAYFNDDFKWHKVQKAIRESVAENVSSFPASYRYEARLQLDRYDFEGQVFRFTEKAGISNVNAFGLYASQDSGCPDADLKYIPKSFRGVLDAPISLPGLPLAPKMAEALLAKMKADNNTDRIVYARFNLRVVYVDPFRRKFMQGVAREGDVYAQPLEGLGNNSIRFDMRLDSVDFFEDQAATQLIYSYKS